jgi:hypothetical protein
LPGFAARSRQDAASPPAATRAPAAARRRSPGSGEQTTCIVQPLLEFAWPWTRRPEDPAVRRGRTRAAQPDPGHPRGPFAPQVDPPDLGVGLRIGAGRVGEQRWRGTCSWVR